MIEDEEFDFIMDMLDDDESNSLDRTEITKFISILVDPKESLKLARASGRASLIKFDSNSIKQFMGLPNDKDDLSSSSDENQVENNSMQEKDQRFDFSELG
jgi:hypothetical protein